MSADQGGAGHAACTVTARRCLPTGLPALPVGGHVNTVCICAAEQGGKSKTVPGGRRLEVTADGVAAGRRLCVSGGGVLLWLRRPGFCVGG